jgi:hypothetical protein
MKHKVPTIIFGIFFAIALAVLAYFTLVLGIALVFMNNGWFIYFAYLFGGLSIATFIGACLTKKCIKYTRIIYTISLAVNLFIAIYVCFIEGIQDVMGIVYLYFGISILGIIATVFAVITIKIENGDTL